MRPAFSDHCFFIFKMKTVKAPALFPRGLTAGEAEPGEVRADGKEPHDMGEAAVSTSASPRWTGG